MIGEIEGPKDPVSSNYQQSNNGVNISGHTINFTGLTHDHSGSGSKDNGQENSQLYCSAITILRRHPMYDCLILVKKYRNCLRGFSLEFPLDLAHEHELEPIAEPAHLGHSRGNSTSEARREQPANGAVSDTRTTTQKGPSTSEAACCGRRLVSRFLDGDDPISVGVCGNQNLLTSTIGSDSEGHKQQSQQYASPNTFVRQLDDRGEPGELIHVPVNGLLDRLAGYTRQGLSVDSRVYAFAMGLKTAERLMTTRSMRELHETPI